MSKISLSDYTIIEELGGHVKTTGCTAGMVKNFMYKVLDTNNKELYIMSVEPDLLCMLCEKSYDKILEYEREKNDGIKLTFSKLNDYVCCCTTHEGRLYIHQIIMNCYRNGRGTKDISVDHIDRNPLNNTIDNLRIATREMQQLNSHGILPGTKRRRATNAQELPEGLTQVMLPKYVVYMKNVYNKEKNLTREYFRIDHHPNLESYDGCKSGKKTIFEKLEEIKKIVEDADKGILPKSQKELSELPTYVRLAQNKDKRCLIYEKRTPTGRQSVKMTLPSDCNDMQKQVQILLQKVKDKYES